MNEDLYEVRVDGIPYATNISLEAAMALVEALFKKWFAEPNLAIEILRITKSTNADRIRSMTDEELANFITDIDWDDPCPPDNSCSCSSSNCMKGWLEWLKKEVEHDG